MEDPVYRLNREQYYGYFPTCWRRFPQGWGCPSPEAPDVEKAFRDLPLEKPSELAPIQGEEMGPIPGLPAGEPGAGAEGMPGQPGRPGPGNLPALPRGGRSPFEIDEGMPATPPGTSPNPNPNQPIPGPIEPTRPPTSLNSLPGPIEAPATNSASRPRGTLPATAPPPTGVTEPLLALPDPAAPPTASAIPTGGSAMNPGSVPPGSSTLANETTGSILAPIYQPPSAPAPAQAPTRRGPISSFFYGLIRR
jgi:hypothetical protein